MAQMEAEEAKLEEQEEVVDAEIEPVKEQEPAPEVKEEQPEEKPAEEPAE